MASGTIPGKISNTSRSGDYTFWVEWKSSRISGTNSSSVTATAYVKSNGGWDSDTVNSNWTQTITINGSKASRDIRVNIKRDKTRVTLISHTVTVKHDNDGSKTITISANCKLGSTNYSSFPYSPGTGTASESVDLDKIPRVPPTAASITFSANPIPHTSTCKVGASGGNWGDAGKGTYTFEYRKKGATSWTQLYKGGTSSASFTPSGKGGTYGTVFEFRVILTNAINQTATSGVKSLTCAPQPAAPKSLAAAPRPIKRNETVRLTWAAGASGDKSYQVRVRYYNGSSWSGYQSIGNTTSTSFSHTPSSLYTLSPKGKLEYSVRAQDKYSRDTGYTAIEVGIRGGLMPVKVNGAWNTDAQAKVKTDGTWTDADSIYVKAGGAWKSQI